MANESITQPSKKDIAADVSQAQKLHIDMEAVPLLILSFVIGSGTGLLMLLRYGRGMKAQEVISSALLSGTIAVMLNSYLLTKGIGWQVSISICIATGLGGDAMIRAFGKIIATAGSGLLTAFMTCLKQLINPNLFKK